MATNKTTLFDRIKAFFSRKPATPVDPPIENGIYQHTLENGHVLIGADHDAIEEIGNITFTDFPDETATELAVNDDILEVESDKAVETFKTPIAGKVVAFNQALIDNPDAMNTSLNQDNWIIELIPN